VDEKDFLLFPKVANGGGQVIRHQREVTLA
jgi:hypothetical protein